MFSRLSDHVGFRIFAHEVNGLKINRAKIQQNLISSAIAEFEATGPFVLATLVNVDGSSPYPIGSQMLINQTGVAQGQITSGCVESAIAEHALEALASNQSTHHRYGEGSPYFDIVLPCGSGIDVYFDVIDSIDNLKEIETRLAARQTVDYTIQLHNFTRTYIPQIRLCLFGEGAIFLSLAELALSSGLDVVLATQHLPTQQQLGKRNFSFNSFDPTVVDSCDQWTAFVSVFHEHDKEIELLRNALSTEAFYIGALGSKRTQAQRLDRLREYEACEEQLKRIQGPVGLDIKAETPQQIAISIIAEIILKMPKLHKVAT